MQEGELVAAIAAGDPGGIAEAYDRYAGSLYAYCLFRLTSPGAAAEAVLDTFAVATVKLPALRDPQRLGPWLHAVARNECLRRLEPSGGTFPATGPMPVTRPGPPPGAGAAGGSDEFSAGPPAELRGQVLTVCTDPSPGGRAHRAALAERAGMFGPTGFPTAAASSGPRWWRPVRRHPRIAAALAASALAVAAGITALTAGGGSGQPRIITMTLGDGDTRTTADNASTPGTPSGTPRRAVTSTAVPGRAPSPVQTVSGAPPLPTARASASAQVSASAPAPGKPSASAAVSASASAVQGYLMVSPTKLVLTGVSGEAASGTFVITALNGPVGVYTVTVPKALAGQVSVSPSSGSLLADNWVTVTVTVTSKVAVDTQVTVGPGSIPVTVLLSVTA